MKNYSAICTWSHDVYVMVFGTVHVCNVNMYIMGAKKLRALSWAQSFQAITFPATYSSTGLQTSCFLIFCWSSLPLPSSFQHPDSSTGEGDLITLGDISSLSCIRRKVPTCDTSEWLQSSTYIGSLCTQVIHKRNLLFRNQDLHFLENNCFRHFSCSMILVLTAIWDWVSEGKISTNHNVLDTLWKVYLHMVTGYDS